MNREIKFRGKRKDTGEWVHGGYHKHIKRQLSPIGDELKDDDVCHLIIQSGFADWNMPKPLQAVEVDPETVGQYTGLNDRNNKEIYSGDTLQVIEVSETRTLEYSSRVEFIDSGYLVTQPDGCQVPLACFHNLESSYPLFEIEVVTGGESHG